LFLNNMDELDLKNELIEYGKALGFGIIKVTDVKPFDLWKNSIENIKSLDPSTSDSWDKRGMVHDVKDILPSANSIIVAVFPYVPYEVKFPNGYGSYSAHYKYYPIGHESMKKLGEFLIQKGYRAIIDAPFSLKSAANRAGVGYFGKNGVIHTKAYGSFITLHSILTDAKLPADGSMDGISDCGQCSICVNSCPTGAIGPNGAIIQSRCVRYNMHSSDFIPVDIREKIGQRLLGCDICQMVCPRNKMYKDKYVLPPWDEVSPFNIKSLMANWDRGLKGQLSDMGDIIGKNFARAQRILSTAVIIAGNSKDESYIPYLEHTLVHPHPPIRGHSAWAIGRIGGSRGLKILKEALKCEKHPKVLEEIRDGIDNIVI
jgi:epoxyqueuosine reductase